ncbi:MAG: hypothetical protein EAZ13_09835 [Sphingobacteriia bacterium]|nr:MAG: hypothetical protein EAZ41_10715 [Sphingobacteriia bacterium]TAG29805.1 MAG: hypothetical protein EAZ35_09265 [Sphingobacteriia bacterium]TAH06334.1 MAG: hypothetical protein EAZ13_09835 [Sphingobacteriia bacterium]
MHIVLHALTAQKELLNSRFNKPDITLSWFEPGDAMPMGDLYIDGDFEENGACFNAITHAPVLVNSVIATTVNMPANFVRFNGWNGFIENSTMEIAAGNKPAIAAISECLKCIDQSFLLAPDTPGMISARVVAMIVNEAYFGLGDGISTKKDIDIAMKLGTNYPYGPFEWSTLIGLKKIYALLVKLKAINARYEIAPALYNELK